MMFVIVLDMLSYMSLHVGLYQAYVWRFGKKGGSLQYYQVISLHNRVRMDKPGFQT